MKLTPLNTYNTPEFKPENRNDKSNIALLLAMSCICLVGFASYHFIYKAKKNEEEAAKLKMKDSK